MKLPSWLCFLIPALAVAAEPATFGDALTQGKASVNARLRLENVEQTGLRDADALTLRLRLGYATAPYQGWKFLIEGEGVLAADSDAYSQSGLNAGGAGHAVVADPETTELSQAWAAFTTGATTATLGRQRLVLDNARFIGDSGWRQHPQNFDAFVLRDQTFAKTTLTYAYLDNVNRVVSRRHAQGRWRSDSHLFNASYAGLPAGTLTGYAYLLDFERPAYAANSCATYGASFAGATALNDTVKLTYRAEAATQSDYGSSALNYRANYTLLEIGFDVKPVAFTLGHEELGAGNNIGFKTPLATLHAFNGWADLFPTTPAAGLRDTYIKATATLPGALTFTAFLHRFETDKTSVRLGTEFDAMLARKFNQNVSAAIKYADFHRSVPTYPEVRKIWIQIEFAH